MLTNLAIVADAFLVAESIRVEFLSLLVVTFVVMTATLFERHTFVTTEDVVFIADPSLQAGFLAVTRRSHMVTCGVALWGTMFIVAVGWAKELCYRTEICFSPLINFNTPFLAYSGIGGQTVAPGALLAVVKTSVKNTVFEVLIRVFDGMAFGKGPFWILDFTTVVVGFKLLL